mmetsp:Transcript_40526/g.107265  ORF Transcript_40526/g.107265 Transcript_40526/m.107265 type:complete len:208 (+) Transcript_40526:197-820(+)
MVHTTAIEFDTAIWPRKLIIMTAEAESTPLVGSSRKSMDGRFARAKAIESRRLLPPDSPRRNSLPAFTSCDSSRPTSLTSLSMACFRSGAFKLGWYSSIAYPRWSRTVSAAQRLSYCWTYAHRSLYIDRVSGSPLTLMWPLGLPPFFSRVSMFSSVVFPAPLGPRMASTWPVVTEPLISTRSSRDLVFLRSLSRGPAGLPARLVCTV